MAIGIRKTFLESLLERRFPGAHEVRLSPFDDFIEVRVRYSPRDLGELSRDPEKRIRRTISRLEPQARRYRPSFRKLRPTRR